MDGNEVRNKLQDFFRNSFVYYGKEIALDSNQHFTIDQIVDNEQEEVNNYHIQYGFPQSGCVSMNCSYIIEEKRFSIDGVTIYAPSEDKEFLIANVLPEVQDGVVNVRTSFGLDMNTEEHTTVDSILGNPNAIKMLEVAINDLSHAEIIGECLVSVPIGSEFIPCTVSSPKTKGKSK